MKKPTFDLTQSEALESFCLSSLPHGSGIDGSWSIGLRGANIVCRNSFHNMDENGSYCGWSDFTLFVNPFEMETKVTGGNENIRDYLEDMFREWLSDHKKEIAEIMGVNLIPYADRSAIFNAVHSWRGPLIAKYGSPNQWPAWLTEVSKWVNAVSTHIDNLTDYKGGK